MKSGKWSQILAYKTIIVIFGAFAKKNAGEIGFENQKEIHTVGQLLSFTIRIMKKFISLSILSLISVALMGCAKETIVENGNTVTVDYVGKLQDGTVFDTSIESVAKESGKYMTGRNYEEGLTFTAGAGQMIAGFDQGVIDMKVGETKTVTIEPKDAYGERDEAKLLTVKKDQIPDGDQYEVGMQVMSQNGQIFKVYEVKKDEIVFDTNHELAGKTLIFDITVKNIEK